MQHPTVYRVLAEPSLSLPAASTAGLSDRRGNRDRMQKGDPQGVRGRADTHSVSLTARPRPVCLSVCSPSTCPSLHPSPVWLPRLPPLFHSSLVSARPCAGFQAPKRGPGVAPVPRPCLRRQPLHSHSGLRRWQPAPEMTEGQGAWDTSREVAPLPRCQSLQRGAGPGSVCAYVCAVGSPLLPAHSTQAQGPMWGLLIHLPELMPNLRSLFIQFPGFATLECFCGSYLFGDILLDIFS